jgi:hypothetical protein
MKLITPTARISFTVFIYIQQEKIFAIKSTFVQAQT